nr:hypothetical protein Iba_scaffold45636CG0010 [Ipomoea batatas]
MEEEKLSQCCCTICRHQKQQNLYSCQNSSWKFYMESPLKLFFYPFPISKAPDKYSNSTSSFKFNHYQDKNHQQNERRVVLFPYTVV